MEQDLWQYLKAAKKPIVLYGMGNGADKIINVLNGYGIQIKGVFATDGFVRDKYFHEFKLTTYDVLKEQFGQMIVLLSFGSGREEVFRNIERISAEQEFFIPDVPVYGDGLFTNAFYNEHKADFDFVYSHLADELSKKTFENIISYKISGKFRYLYDCETEVDEAYSTFLKFGNNESYLDLGAYNGDTVLDFISRVEAYNSITAVEPDIKTFVKLNRNTANVTRLKTINACITDFNGEQSFAMRGGRNSGIGKGEIIKAITVDSIEAVPTFIKMDIEGEELKAIYGAEKTIKNHKPKMQIAAYHRNEDLFTIPKAVLNIRNDYKLYLRHNPCVPAWDTNYFFI